MSWSKRLGRDLAGALADDVHRSRVFSSAATASPVTEEEIADLPTLVQRYLRAMGAVGRERVWSFRGRFLGQFRLRPGSRWTPCEAYQYDAARPIARFFRMRVDVGGLVPLVGLDRYVDGLGSIRARAFGLVPVLSSDGPDLDIGELVTYLADALVWAPSMLLGAPATWTQLDDERFEVALSDHGCTVRVRATIDDRGLPTQLASDDRFAHLAGGLVRAGWRVDTSGWITVDGRALPTSVRATWDLPEGSFSYLDGELYPGAFEINVRPHEPLRHAATAPSGWPRVAAQAVDTVDGVVRLAGSLVAAPLLQRRQARWGASEAEVAAAMPGDEIVPCPRSTSTRAVTIDVGPEAVWPWLAQIGHGRGGLYSYDVLEDLVGCDLHSADRIVPAWQDRAVGDLVAMGPEGYPCFRVAAVEPRSSLVLEGVDPHTHARPERTDAPTSDRALASWAWVLQPIDGGTRTRLVSRQRTSYPRCQEAMWRLVGPVDHVMERRMLLGIKARAEAGVPVEQAAAAPLVPN